MELLKRSIHMDRVSCKADTQFTLEDDVNLSDSKPDITKILFSDGSLHIEESRCLEGHIHVKGKLKFRLLYESEDAFGQLFSAESSVNFEETINADGIECDDSPVLRANLENLTVNLINSRKMSVQALIFICAIKEELYDEEVSVGITESPSVEFQKINHSFCGISVLKKDIFRIKAEQELPANFPNITDIIWKELRICDIEFRTPDGKITIRGNLGVFVLYKSETEKEGFLFYETTLPFSGSIDCYGCNETLVPLITYSVMQKEIDVRQDLDGEDRILGIDVVLDLSIKLFAEENLEIIRDLYGVNGDIATQSTTGFCKRLLGRNQAKMRIAKQVTPDNISTVVSLLYSRGDVFIDESEITEEGISITGSLSVTTLYKTDDDHFPFASASYDIPFNYLLDMPGLYSDCKFSLQTILEDLLVTGIGPGEFDVKALISFAALCSRDEPIMLLSSVSESTPDPVKINSLPGMTAYYVKDGDTLWNIGKQYYVPVNRIREVNGLNNDTLKAGDKLLIVR